MPRRRRSAGRFVPWACTFAGGVVTGVGLVLMAQVRVIRYVQGEIGRLNAIERLLGKATFLWRSLDEKVALALGEISHEHLEHTHFAGLALALFGLLGVGIALPRLLRGKWVR